MKCFKKCLFLFVLGFFINLISVSAKEVVFYYYADGGEVNTPGFYVNEYGDFITYSDTFFASYKGKDKITNINSMSRKTFTITKNGTSLVKGREWYFKNALDNKYYFFSESKTYTVDSIFKTLNSTDTFYDFDLYPNWQNNPIKEGVDIKEGEGKTPATSFKISALKTNIYVGDSVALKATFEPAGSDVETITWTSSNKSIATINEKGKVTGKKEGTVKITGKTKKGLTSSIEIHVLKLTSKNHSVQIEYHANGGKMLVAHGEKFTIKNDVILKDGKNIFRTIVHGDTTPSYGLANTHSPNYINLYRNGYYLIPSEAWNTKADGTGTTYSQTKVYKSTDFCDASTKDCKVVLYANWKKDATSLNIALVGNSKTRYIEQFPTSRVADIFLDLLSTTGKTAHVTIIVKGGSSLTFKANNDPYKKKLTDNKYDIVVMQEKAEYAAEKGGSHFLKGAKEVKKIVEANNSNIKYFVRTSWYKNNDSLDSDIATMITNATKVAGEIGGTPIYDGKAFLTAKKKGINVFLPDNSHPTHEGAYLAAICIYKKVFNVNASDIHYYYGLNSTVAKTIQSIVDENC